MGKNNLESNNQPSQDIETELNKLNQKTEKGNGFFDIVRGGENGFEYFLKINGKTLDLGTQSQNKIIAIAQLSQKILMAYKTAEHNTTDNPLYIEESNSSKGDPDNVANMEIMVKDGIAFFDIKFLTENGFKNAFGHNPGRNDTQMKEYVRFLNYVLTEGINPNEEALALN